MFQPVLFQQSARERAVAGAPFALTVVVALVCGRAGAEETPIEKAAAAGKNPIIVVEADRPAESALGRPDLLFLKDGRVLEVWALRMEGPILGYHLRGEDGELASRTRAKYEVVAIQPGRSLEDYRKDQEQASAPDEPLVTRARKQPVRHEEVLAGRFAARQGRSTRWLFTFKSELNKYYEYAQNATEYGTFVLRSHNRQEDGGELLHESETIAKGRYFLYAPGVFGNEDWVLNLSRVSYSENDLFPHQSMYTEKLQDEVFLLKLARDRNVFHLEWANHEGWQWTSPTQQTFYRIDAPRAGLTRRAPVRAGSGTPSSGLSRRTVSVDPDRS